MDAKVLRIVGFAVFALVMSTSTGIEASTVYYVDATLGNNAHVGTTEGWANWESGGMMRPGGAGLRK